jgi:enamine deaminase RidA (YjgF/YER057c/UK114 family)
VQRINPPALLAPLGGKHAHIVVPPAGSQFAFIAGQVAFDLEGNVVGRGDYYRQSQKCFECIRDALAALQAGPGQIVKMTIYVRDYRPQMLELVSRAGTDVFGDNWPVTATTLIGVQALGMAEFLVEIEAQVALPPGRTV